MQEHLMHGYGYLHLEEGYNLYSSFSEFSCRNTQAFRDKLLDPHHGLPVYKESSARLFSLVMKGVGLDSRTFGSARRDYTAPLHHS